MALLLSLGSEPELLLLRSQVLEKSGHSVITVSNIDYAVPVSRSATFDGVIFCHLIPPKMRDNVIDQMLSNSRRSIPAFVFQKPLAPGDNAALTVVGNKSPQAAALCRELIESFRFSSKAKQQSLQSWKQIAAYMGRGVRTVQRWEQFGLPVHRPSRHGKGAVFALVAEVDQWMKSAQNQSADFVV